MPIHAMKMILRGELRGPILATQSLETDSGKGNNFGNFFCLNHSAWTDFGGQFGVTCLLTL